MLNLRVFGLGFSRVPPPPPPLPPEPDPKTKRTRYVYDCNECVACQQWRRVQAGEIQKVSEKQRASCFWGHEHTPGPDLLCFYRWRHVAFSIVQCFVPLLHTLWRWTAAGKTAQTCMRAVHCSAEQRSWAMRPGKKHLRKPGEGFRPKSR